MGMSFTGMKCGVTLLFATVLCLQPVAAQDPAGGALPAGIEIPSDLSTVLRSYEAAWEGRDAVGLADLFTPDGFVLRPGHPPAHGRDAILAAYANSGGPLVLTPYAYQVEGEVGYIIGGYAPAVSFPDVGKFVLALRRGPSGAWLIAADIDNGN